MKLYVVSKFHTTGQQLDDMENSIQLVTNDIDKAIAKEEALDNDSGNYYGIIDIVLPEKVSITL